ncbi:hypothetical protein L1286_23870, partial [Pseudoalteromonas sp. SMS1]|uniref:hypothetical protein n=1 Tax=Pseudoalteromonas sp. SMS1 TaxID=2908894 RepID=UPI001F2A3468
ADNTTESYTYYDNGLKATYTNQKGATWDYTYDNQGRLTEESGPEASYHYWDNDVLKSTSSGKMTKAMTYDDMGNVIALKEGIKVNGNWLSGAHTETTFSYDLAGRPYKSYDNAGRIYRERDGEGYVTERTFDALGRETTLIRYANAGSYSNGEITVSKSEGDRKVTTSYGTNGLKKSVSQGEQYTEFTYNAFGEEVKKEQLVSGSWDSVNTKTVTAYTYYNTRGQRSAQVDEGHYLTTYEYNAHGELERQIEYAQSVTGALSTTSPPTGTPGNPRDGQNREVSFHYDKMGRTTHKVHHNVIVAVKSTGEFNYSNKDKLVEYKEYDELGKVRTAITVASDLTQPETYRGADTAMAKLYDYDAIGRLTVSANQYDKYVNTDVTSLSQAQINGLGSEASGREATSYQYDLFGNVVAHRVFASRLATHDRNSGKLGTPAHSSQDRVTQHQYDLRGNLNKEIDANGNIKVHHYDAHNRLKKTTEAFSQWSLEGGYSFKYSGRVTDADGTIITIDEQQGLPTGVNFNPQTGKVTMSDYLIREKYTYSIVISAGAAHIAPANKRSQSFTLSSANTAYSVAHWQPAVTGGSQTLTTEHRYDKNGNVTAKSIGLGATANTFTWHTQYNGFGEVTKDAKGKYFYNTLGQLYRSDKDDGVYQSYYYDKAGRMTRAYHELNGTTKFEHDGLGRVITIALPYIDEANDIAGNKHQVFDRWGNIISVTDEVGATTRAEYNHANQVIREILPVVKVVSDTGVAAYIAPDNTYRYDATGNLVSKTDANGHTHRFEYDKKGNQIAHQDGAGHIQRQYHDIHSQKVIDKNGLGHITVTTHDKLGQTLETGRYGIKAQGDIGYRLVNRYAYDEVGNRTHETNAEGGEVAYHFDALGNVIFSQDEMSRHKHYSYNREGLQTSEQYSSIYNSNNAQVHRITRNYNDHGQLVGGNDLSGKNFTLKYGKNFGESLTVQGLNDDGHETNKRDIGRLIERTNEHGQHLVYTYYDNGWIKSITDKTNDAFSQFEYDLAGRRTRELKQSWDDLERVIRHETRTYYDSHGRISLVKTTEYKNAAADGAAPSWQKGDIISRTRYTYDAAGNRRSMIVENGFTGPITALSNTGSSVSSQSFHFASGSLGGGNGEIQVTNTQGLTPGRTDVTFQRAGQVIFKPDWLDYEIV